MTLLEAVRAALAEVGDVPDAELAAAVARHGLKIAPAYIPVAKAQLRGLRQLEESRRAAREFLATAEAAPKKRHPGGER